MKYRILALLIVLFSLSQVSSLVVSLFKYNYASSMIVEEETEKEASFPKNVDDKYCVHAYSPRPIIWISKDRLYLDFDIRIITAYMHQPETPPPNFC